MVTGVKRNQGETERHARLKRLAFLWAQAQGYSAAAMEVSLPRCRYRADVAAYRPQPKDGSQAACLTRQPACQPGKTGDVRQAGSLPSETGSQPIIRIGSTAIFECKQTLCDLRRDNCQRDAARQRFETISQRRHLLETRLRVHYPNLRNGDFLFPEFDLPDFTVIGHHGYARVLRELKALQNRLCDCTKFDKLIRYRCANLFFLVLPKEFFRDSEIPVGWGALVESDGTLTLLRKPEWQKSALDNQVRLLQRIAMAGTRSINRQLEITFADVMITRATSYR
jgi:hypothetical protein